MHRRTEPDLERDPRPPGRRARAATTGGAWRSWPTRPSSPRSSTASSPNAASEWDDGPSRRQFLRLMGASLALAGVSGCGFDGTGPRSSSRPSASPRRSSPARPLFFATALTLGGYATGVLVESHMGRPIKIEGNERTRPASAATDPFIQASVLTLYDPDRSQVVLREGQISTSRTSSRTSAAPWTSRRPARGRASAS